MHFYMQYALITLDDDDDDDEHACGAERRKNTLCLISHTPQGLLECFSFFLRPQKEGHFHRTKDPMVLKWTSSPSC